MCIFKKFTKIGEFLGRHFNIEDGTKYAMFWHIMFYYLKKSKNAIKMHLKRCAVYREGAVSDRMCQKWFAKI